MAYNGLKIKLRTYYLIQGKTAFQRVKYRCSESAHKTFTQLIESKNVWPHNFQTVINYDFFFFQSKWSRVTPFFTIGSINIQQQCNQILRLDPRG